MQIELEKLKDGDHECAWWNKMAIDAQNGDDHKRSSAASSRPCAERVRVGQALLVVERQAYLQQNTAVQSHYFVFHV